MGESRNQHVVTRHRRWAVGLALAAPLALAVSQAWVAHATAPVQSAFTPITPVRALDSRSTLGMHLSPGHETDVWQVTGTTHPSRRHRYRAQPHRRQYERNDVSDPVA